MSFDNYPSVRVISSYSLFTGLISGLLFGIPMFVWALIKGESFGQLILPFAVVSGAIFLFIPSLILGIFLSKSQFCIVDRQSWAKLLGIGFFYATCCSALYLLFNLNNFSESWNSVLLMSLIFSIVYSVSIVIVGKFVLPKR